MGKAMEAAFADGSYAEAKEVVGGYAVVEARSQEEAVAGGRMVVQLHKELWPGGADPERE